MDLKNKTILLTNYNVANYTGSEINCLSLAKALKQMGAYVEVATLNYAYPIRDYYERAGIKVKNVFFDPLDYDEYDIIWAHHGIVLTYVLSKLHVSAKKIVYSSLSSSDPYETAPAYAGELSLILANSAETKETLVTNGVERESIEVFPNYVTEKMFKEEKQSTPSVLKRIAVVSNHIPEELLSAINTLQEKDYAIDIFGKGYKQILITEKELKEYDAVVTIGKTVQYSLAMGIPVYCYDIHGGPGWLQKDNYKQSFYYNFSGRGFGRKKSEEICEELSDPDKYKEAVADISELRGFIGNNCILESNITSLLTKLDDTKGTDGLFKLLKTVYSSELRVNELMISLYRYNLHREMQIIDLEKEKQTREQDLKEITAKLDEVNKCLSNSEKRIESINTEFKKYRENYYKLLSESVNDKKTIISLKEKCEDKSRELERLRKDNEEKSWFVSEVLKSKAWKWITKYREIKIRIKSMFTKRRNKASNNYEGPTDNHETNEDKAELQVLSAEKSKLVTVGIPVYDRTDVLRTCIDSILGQTYENIEIIVVCDGSPEDTLEIVKEYERANLVRAYYYDDNSGNAVRGRNRAIREAYGEYFAFMDSDDVAEPDRIKISVEYIEQYGADVVYGGWRAIVDGTREIGIKDGQEVYSPDCNLDLLQKVCVPCQSTVMARTEVLKSVGGLKTCMRYREDHELWLRMAYAGFKYKAIPKVLVNLRLHSGNLELAFKDTDNTWSELMMTEYKKIIPFKPKIAYVIPGCGISGGIAVICQHLNRLKSRGYDVIMICESEEREINWFPNQTVEIVGVNEVPGNIDALVATGWTTAFTAEKIPAREKYYFVQSDETRFSAEGTEAYYLAKQSYTMNFSFITEARWIQKWLEETYGKIAAYVPNGLDESIVHCTEVRKYPLDRKVRVLLEGPIDIPYKGMEDAFAAVQDLDCEVWCISSAGVPREGWRCDRFFSKVPMSEMKFIYSQCDILLKMSRVEGFFGPPMEMMACGGTCVVGKVTGYDEYIVDGFNALVVEQGDIKGAHDALKKLIDDENFRKELSENGIRTAKQWKWENSIDILENVFMEKAYGTGQSKQHT